MNRVLVFMGTTLYGEYSPEEYKAMRKSVTTDLRNMAYVRIATQRPHLPESLGIRGWYRMDGTPILDADLPKELLVLALLLT